MKIMILGGVSSTPPVTQLFLGYVDADSLETPQNQSADCCPLLSRSDFDCAFDSGWYHCLQWSLHLTFGSWRRCRCRNQLGCGSLGCSLLWARCRVRHTTQDRVKLLGHGT